jgi:hypothetical protein
VPSRRPSPPSRGAPSPATTARRLYGAYFDRLSDEDKVNAAIADFGDAHAAERAFTTAHLAYLNVVQAGQVTATNARLVALLEAVLDRQDRLLAELRNVNGQLRGLQVATRRRVRPQRRTPEPQRFEPQDFEDDSHDGPDFDEGPDFALPDELHDVASGDVDSVDGITLVDENGHEIEVEES